MKIYKGETIALQMKHLINSLISCQTNTIDKMSSQANTLQKSM